MSRLCALLAIAMLLAACASRAAAPARSVRSTAGSAASSAPARPVVIERGEGLVFRPSTDVPASALSPSEAWTRYERRSHGKNTRIPAAARVQYGTLTCVSCNLTQTRRRMPCGKSAGLSWACIHVRTLAYSIAHTGCMNTNPNFSPPPHWECTEWIFLYARTGRMIIETWQQTNPPPSR